jgi:hypothetical protein
MLTAESPLPIILLVLCLTLLLAILLVLLRIASRLNEFKRGGTLAEKARHTAELVAPSPAETLPGGAFEAFLAEDPARRMLGKSDQFSAYRKWRQENGLNWSTNPIL